jgi:hypothetical protein
MHMAAKCKGKLRIREILLLLLLLLKKRNDKSDEETTYNNCGVSFFFSCVCVFVNSDLGVVPVTMLHMRTAIKMNYIVKLVLYSECVHETK